MEVSPKTLREVEFREKMRGYHPEDVDQFLEQVAAGIEVLQDRLRQAVERAQRAEAAASESGGADETLRKTLVLAQRTADMAIQEAREQAARILASAEQQAQSVLGEAEERARRTMEDTVAEARTELGRLETSRGQAQQEVDTLQRWVEEHKEHLRATLGEALAAVDRAGVLWPAPTTHPIDTGARRAAMAPALPPSGPELDPGPSDGMDAGPDTMMWASEAGVAVPAGIPAAVSAAPIGSPAPATPPEALAPEMRHEDSFVDPDQQALDDFFDEANDLDDEPRFGGRLRRRR